MSVIYLSDNQLNDPQKGTLEPQRKNSNIENINHKIGNTDDTGTKVF